MLKSFLTSTAIALSLSLAPISVFAETETITAEKLALINELRILTNSDENSTQVLDIMIQQMQDQGAAMGDSLFGDGANPAATAAFDATFSRVTERMYRLMKERIDFAALQRQIDTQLYNEYYTEAELADLIAFYQTPTGQKTAEILPQLTQRSMELVSAQITPTLIEIQQQVLIEELGGFGLMEDGSAPQNEEEYKPTTTDELQSLEIEAIPLRPLAELPNPLELNLPSVRSSEFASPPPRLEPLEKFEFVPSQYKKIEPPSVSELTPESSGSDGPTM